MTTRQKDALRWLEQVGEANQFAVHRAGYQQRTLDALVEQGRVVLRVVQGRVRPFNVYLDPAYARAMETVDAHEAVEA
jgi:hypothetical protein